MAWTNFIPATMERVVAENIVFRPHRTWHTGCYAGEGLEEVRGDRSGCVRKTSPLPTCSPPLTVTHRIYWNKVTGKQLSCFLSYPDAMGCHPDYFWEVYPVSDDVERFYSEEEMEAKIIELLTE